MSSNMLLSVNVFTNWRIDHHNYLLRHTRVLFCCIAEKSLKFTRCWNVTRIRNDVICGPHSLSDGDLWSQFFTVLTDIRAPQLFQIGILFVSRIIDFRTGIPSTEVTNCCHCWEKNRWHRQLFKPLPSWVIIHGYRFKLSSFWLSLTFSHSFQTRVTPTMSTTPTGSAA